MNLPVYFRISVLSLCLILIVLITGCEQAANAEPVLPEAATMAVQKVESEQISITPTAGQTATKGPAEADGEISTTLPKLSTVVIPTSTQIPTYTILHGEVLVRSNCRYGPGAPYLYKYGLVPGSNLDVIGRNDQGTWILIQAIGGNNPCWVKASLMDVKGDVMSVAPTYIPLPQSKYYGPLRAVSAQRDGDQVTVFWGAVQFRAGDETASPPYLVEAWICRRGELVFIPLGVYENVVVIEDEAGCREPSHAQVLLAEKHGYTRPVEIPWPSRDLGDTR